MFPDITPWLARFLPQGNQLRYQYILAWMSLALGLSIAVFLYTSAPLQVHPLILASFALLHVALSIGLHAHIPKQHDNMRYILALTLWDTLLLLLCQALYPQAQAYVYLLLNLFLLFVLLGFGLGFLYINLTLTVLGQVVIYLALSSISLATLSTQVLMLVAWPVVALIMRKQAQPALLLRQNFLDVLDLSPIPIFTFHISEDTALVRTANKPLLKLLHQTKEAIANQPVSILTLKEDGEEIMRYCKQTLLNPDAHPSNALLIRACDQSGKTIRLLCIANRLEWQGEQIGACCLVDITALEEQRATMNHSLQAGYMSTLVAGIVHDFRNTLTHIIGSAEILALTIEDDAAKKQVHRIIQAGEHGADLVTRLLHLSRTHIKQQGITATDMPQTLHNLVALLRHQLPAHIKLNCDIPNTIPSISLLVSELEQILVNLVNNAAQAIDKQGEICIRVTEDSIISHQQNTPVIKLSVSDTGCGIPQEHIPLVTQSFWTSRQDQGGTGLGLAMVQHIVNQHRGIMQISSTPNAGTTVNIYLPLYEQNEFDSSMAKNTTKAKHKPCCILLVDDSIEVLEVHSMLLSSMGHTVYTAQTPEQALNLAKQHHIDLLVTDLRMPSMDGVELAKTLRKQQPSLPVLVISAYDKVNHDKRIQTLRAYILLKPGTFEKLNKMIGKIQDEHPEVFS